MKRFFVSLLAVIAAAVLQAEVVLPGWMTSNMVLQQQTVMHLQATGKKGATVKITTSWDGQSTRVKTDPQTGSFSFELRVPKAGGPYTLTFDDGQRTVLDNVMAGEVWFCSGQSNMEMPLHSNWASVRDWQREVAEARHPMVRLFQVKKTVAHTPQAKVPYGHTNGWVECTPEMAEGFSAAAYFFAREVSRELGIAVGVVNSSWGGTPAESWVSHERLRHVEGYEEKLKKIAETGFDESRIEALYQAEHADWQQRVFGNDKGLTSADVNHAAWAASDLDDSHWPTMSQPVNWKQNELSAWDGVVWFRRVVDIPADWAGREMKLHLGEVDDQDITYWNGERVGATNRWNAKRQYTVPGRMVKAGRNVVTVRVCDTGGEGGFRGSAEHMKVVAEGKELSLAGPWHYHKSLSVAEINAGGPEPKRPNDSWFPCNLFNAMVAPFLDMPIRGFLWYQGCSNVGRAGQYEGLFQTLILDWQERFNQHAEVAVFPKPTQGEGKNSRRFFFPQENKALPFYFVQLANYLARKDVQPESGWAALREAQRKAQQLDGVGMMVNIDIGEANDIHPKNKQEVGRRLALLALHRTYGRDVPCAAPEFQQMRIQGGKAILTFRPVWGSSPLASNADIKGFTIAGPDHKWHVAKAHTEGEGVRSRVVVACPEVPFPIAVRYAWADNPECNLVSQSGLPVGPFRTDDWPTK